MKDLLSSIKPAVRQLQAYTLRHFEARVKVNQNENPFEMPGPVKAAVQKAMESRAWCRYPAFVPTELAARLARFANWQSDGVLVGNGSNELIEAVLMVTVEPGKRVVIPQPTFTLYKMVTVILGGEVWPVMLTETLDFDVPRLTEAAAEADVTLLCCPNNPTGSTLSLDAMRRIIKAARGLVIVDEAYHEFSRQSAVPLLHEFQHLVVLRTFSKAMAMAGLRVGYLLGHPALVEQIAKAKLPYNLNIYSMAAAEAALEHFALLQPRVELLIQERERLLAGLRQMHNVTAYPSQANFIAFKTTRGAAEVFEALYAKGILVRDISRYPMLANFLRVSVGLPDENDQFLEVLHGFLATSH